MSHDPLGLIWFESINNYKFKGEQSNSDAKCEDAVTTMPPTTIPNTSHSLLAVKYFTTTAQPIIAINTSLSVENEEIDDELDITSGSSSHESCDMSLMTMPKSLCPISIGFLSVNSIKPVMTAIQIIRFTVVLHIWWCGLSWYQNSFVLSLPFIL